MTVSLCFLITAASVRIITTRGKTGAGVLNETRGGQCLVCCLIGRVCTVLVSAGHQDPVVAADELLGAGVTALVGEL